MCTLSIELATFGDENEVGMTDFTGFDFVNFEFHPHFANNQAELELLTKYRRAHKPQIYMCEDGAGIHVSGSEVKTFGNVLIM